ncbi:MAG: hypothetical protein AAB519_00520 [Patescibacteria group bacterium]
MDSFFSRSSLLIFCVWSAIIIAFFIAIFEKQWPVAGLAFAAFLLTLVPFFVEDKLDINIPDSFLATIGLFIYATLILGESSDFYEKFWWWDTILHIGSSAGFGIIGFVILLLLLQGKKLEASAGLIGFFSFTFAVAFGALWEIWEFTLDQTLGLNTQKSGLPDTMGDLIVDSASAFVVALSGYIYLKYGKKVLFVGVINEAFRKNAATFRAKFPKEAKKNAPENVILQK